MENFELPNHWKFSKIQARVLEYVVGHIRNDKNTTKLRDYPWWALNSLSIFIVKNAWDLLRSKGEIDEDLSKLWCTSFPFKICFQD